MAPTPNALCGGARPDETSRRCGASEHCTRPFSPPPRRRPRQRSVAACKKILEPFSTDTPVVVHKAGRHARARLQPPAERGPRTCVGTATSACVHPCASRTFLPQAAQITCARRPEYRAGCKLRRSATRRQPSAAVQVAVALHEVVFSDRPAGTQRRERPAIWASSSIVYGYPRVHRELPARRAGRDDDRAD